jgi:RNA polymerase sigma-70 factor (ECF subfamily)
MFYPALFLLCKKFFADDHEALEALNDGMLKVYKNIAAYNSQKGEFFNWAYTVVRNTALDKLKIHRQPVQAELQDNIPGTGNDNPMRGLEWKDIYKLLDALAPATRAVCSLFYLEGFSIKEISDQLGISSGTIKWHLNETRNKLKPVLKNYYS